MTRSGSIFMLLVLVGACTSKTVRDPGTAPHVIDPNKASNPNKNTKPNTSNGNNTGTPNYVISQPVLPEPTDFGPPAPPVPSFTPSPFLQVTLGPVGAYLSLNGAPFRVLGYEASVADAGNFCDWTGPQLTQAFEAMATQGNVNTVRMWFLQSAGGPPDSNNRNGWAVFDAAIAAAKAHGLRIIATLGNQWGDCEPPFDGHPRIYKNLAWYLGGYAQANDGYPLAYRDYVRAVAQRYAEEPTIAFWQLMNEAEAAAGPSGVCGDAVASSKAMRAFADDMVDVIRSVDSNHLVSLGTREDGVCGPEDANSNYLRIHDGKIDICEVHTYAPATPALPALSKTKIDACKILGKPIFMGEVGFCRVANPNYPGGTTCVVPPDPRATDPNVLTATLAARAQQFDARLQAGLDAGLSGVILWQWSPVDNANGAADPYYGIGVGDPVINVLQKY